MGSNARMVVVVSAAPVAVLGVEVGEASAAASLCEVGATPRVAAAHTCYWRGDGRRSVVVAPDPALLRVAPYPRTACNSPPRDTRPVFICLAAAPFRGCHSTVTSATHSPKEAGRTGLTFDRP
jgi:hypothetical protein